MWVWWFIIVLVLCLGSVSEKYGSYKLINGEYKFRTGLTPYFFAVAIMIIFAGLRSISGSSTIGDTPVYAGLFKSIVKPNVMEFFETAELEGDWGFYALMSLFRQIFHVKEQGLLFLCALITIGGIMYRYYKMSLGNTAMLLYLYVTLGHYVSCMNGTRQWLVSALLFVCMPLIKEKKAVMFFLIVAVLSTMHNSALVFIVLYFVVTKPAWGKVTRYMIIFVILLLVTYPVTGHYIAEFLEGSNYSQYSSDIVSGKGGTNIIRIIAYILPVSLAYFFKNSMRKEPYYDIVMNMAILDMLFMMLAMTNWIYARFCIYFEPYLLIIYLWDFKYCFDKKSKGTVYIIYLLYGAAWFWYQMYIGYGGQKYSSIILGIG